MATLPSPGSSTHPNPLPRLASTSSMNSSPYSSPTPTRSSNNLNLERTGQKRRARILLRDYYGLHGQEAAAGKDPLNIDSGSFDARAYYEKLSNQSLADLLKRENELLTEIRELDSERQSLVYNHHHELIEASDTIKKMKARAESLDTSLDQLKSAFETISQLSTSLSATPPNPAPTLPPPSSTPTFNPLIHLPPLIDLPQTLRSLLNDPTKRGAEWGTWEPALRSWEDAGVKGVKDIAVECREILSRARRSSVTLHSSNLTDEQMMLLKVSNAWEQSHRGANQKNDDKLRVKY